MDIKNKVSDFFKDYPVQTFSKRELLLRAQEPVPFVFYLTEGRVSQYDISSNGNEVVVNVFKPGAFFPMSSVINDVVNNYFFEASLPSAVHVAPKADAIRFLQANPDVLFDLLARVYRGVDGVLRRMAHLMGGDAQSRLIFELLNVAYRFGELQLDGSIIFTFKEGDLARHTGLARETVSRIIKKLKQANLIQVSSAGIGIKDVKQLEALLGTNL